MATLAAEFLPLPRILHPWPSVRFAVKHPTLASGQMAHFVVNRCHTPSSSATASKQAKIVPDGYWVDPNL